MAAAPKPDDLASYLRGQGEKDLLRFITCGSVDDGKSTLIGRLLYESKLLFEDQLAALERDSKKPGTQAGALDFALLVDGLEAEREQGITIDVAYRAFATDARKFIVADTPGHEQYTRNMATGASTADVAVILVDAQKGVLVQTRRHSHIVSLVGIRHVVLAVNKMDLVGFDEATFRRIEADYAAFAATLGLGRVTAIPVSALKGDNVVTPSAATAWYRGPTLLAALEDAPVDAGKAEKPFRMAVQWVNRPDRSFRGYAGTIAEGMVRPGDAVRAVPSGRRSAVARIVTMDGDLTEAVAGQAVTLTLSDEIDVSRGDVLCADKAPVPASHQFEAKLLWMGDEPLLPGRPYLVKIGARAVAGTIHGPKYKFNVNSGEHLAAKTLALNEIGVCTLDLDADVPFAPYAECKALGAFIVVDRLTNNTVGMGMIDFALRRASNIHWQAHDVTKGARATLAGQKPCVLWFTGLSGSGKSTIANLLEKRLHALGCMTYLLDGDNVRHGLNRDLGFTDEDRVENIRRVAEVSKLMVDAGLIVLTAFISPFRSERRMARGLLDADEFVEIFIDTPLEICRARDPKGLYRKAASGELKNMTGIDSPYERPERAELVVETQDRAPEDAVLRIEEFLRARGIL
jgi:bifunctional enzyme CysN/CysC